MEKLTLDKIFSEAIKMGASDIHLCVGEVVIFRIEGNLKRMTSFEKITSKKIQELIFPFFIPEILEKFKRDGEVDFSFSLPEVGRFRGSLYFSKGECTLVLRVIGTEVPNFKELGLPKELYQLVEYKNGLILIVGSTGSGKTTTLASLVEYINQEKEVNIITVEDPIEYVFTNKKSIINQKEIGKDVASFSSALRTILRQDPDIIVIGELRDRESLEFALKASETGHLVISTLHTNGAVETIERIVSEFSKENQEKIYKILGNNLRGIISQEFIGGKLGKRVLIYELLVVNTGVKNMIKTGNINQIYTLMENGIKDGMITKDICMERLRKIGAID